MLQASLQVTLSENDTQFRQLNQNTKTFIQTKNVQKSN